MSVESASNLAGEKALTGRVGIVTGAGTGIGQGIAIALAKQGVNLVIVGRTLETLNSTIASVEKTGASIRYVKGSIAERETAKRAVAEAISAFGRLDVVVNNAHTFSSYFDISETPEENFRIHMESGFFGTLYFMQAAFPHMRERGGSIINVGSIAGLEGWATMAPYNVTKEAIRALSRTASREWGKYKIRVNVIVPSAHSKIADEYLSDPEILKATLARIPLGYIGDPELDIGRVAVFLASEDSRYISGQTLQVDGGM
jgi:NAD(P)-dependent dehydrogenase (short-subunit alcohol dehydrogenase family)